IWVSPFYPSPMKDFGYDVSDYTGVDPLFGTLADFDRLLAAAHERALAVIIDWVPNHTSDQHAWFLASSSSRENPRRDWYVWRDFHKDMGEYGTQLHIYDRGHADTHLVYRDVRRLLERYSGTRARVSVGEIHLFDLAELVAYYGAELDELHMPFNFTLLNVPWSAEAVRSTVDEMEAALPEGAWPNWVLGNHDESRVASRIGAVAARSAMLLLLTLRGTPTLYYGDELGMEDVQVPPELVQDPWGKNVPGLGLGRDPERTPMLWDRSA